MAMTDRCSSYVDLTRELYGPSLTRKTKEIKEKNICYALLILLRSPWFLGCGREREELLNLSVLHRDSVVLATMKRAPVKLLFCK